jgi:hypothetical protein
MKHRPKGTNIKMQHKMVKGLRKCLEKLDKVDEIVSIIPGKIIPIKTKQNLETIEICLVPKKKLINGILCYAYSRGCYQEVYIIGDPEFLWNHFRTIVGR